MSTRARWQSQNNSAPSNGGLSYTTSFSVTENPISESGHWTNGGTIGLDWQNVSTATGAPNKAYGSGTSTGYNDCIAVLSGFAANHSAQATIYREVGYTAPTDGNFAHEIELHLRSQISANFIRGYEIDFWFAGAALQIVRWNGVIGDFTDITSNGSGSGISSLITGDIIKAKMIGNTITVYKNGSAVWTVDDSTYSTGNPGMGFFIRPGGDPTKYCISQFTATSL